ncbi:MAG: hypothetical protein LBB84_00880, partial [Tannerellaceae bacterium]|nr:hypothetical protein [Tannerellaceae bacterium]
YESEEACLIFDETIVSKPYTDENELISWHWDHSKGRNEKGINLLTAFYHTQLPGAAESLRVPVAYLLSNDLELSAEEFRILYKKRLICLPLCWLTSN